MKKFLLTAVLILAVLTSLTAGTLAAYTQTQTIDGNVKAMYFKFTKAGKMGFNSTVSLSPGQSQMYKVEVTNWSEMPVKFTVDKSFTTTTATGNSYKDVLDVVWCNEQGDVLANAPTPQLANGVADNIFLKVTWNDNTTNPETEVAFAQNPDAVATLHVSITGTSVQ